MKKWFRGSEVAAADTHGQRLQRRSLIPFKAGLTTSQVVAMQT